MSISLDLYKFAKKKNSVQLPFNDYPRKNITGVTLKVPTSVTNPTFTIRWPDASDIDLDYNYVYCSALHRYYWIDDIIIVNDKIYDIICSVDVLATYRFDIGELTPYILRSGAVQSEDVVDTYYPIVGEPEEITATSDVNPWPATNKSECIHTMTLLGYVDNDSVYPNHPLKVLGGSFMLMGSQAQMQINSDRLNNPTTILHSALPSDFIIQTMAFPFLRYSAVDYWARRVSGLLGAEWTMTLIDCDISSVTEIDSGTFTYKSPVYHFNRYNHPQANSRGAYLNLSPYTEIKLYAGPFGTLDLDASMFNDLYISYCFDVDLTTGDAILNIWPSSTKTTQRERGIVVIQGKCGINIPVNTISKTMPYGAQLSPIGNANTFLNMGVEAIGNAGILRANAPSSTPKISGVPDTTVSYYNPYCKFIFHRISADNHDEWGYASLVKRKINTAWF